MKKLLILLLFPLMMFAQDTTLIGDVDCSGEVNSQDASLILQFVTNVIDELPCEANMTGLTPDQLQEMIDMMEDQLSINYTAGSSGGVDLAFPDGFDGNGVFWDLLSEDYLVPEGKTLYITNYIAENTNGALFIDNIKIRNGASNSGTYYGLHLPVIVNSGQTISTNTPSNDFSNFSGFLISNSSIMAITHNTSSTEENPFPGSEYTVPDGKKLIITNYFSETSDGNLLVDNIRIRNGESNNGSYGSFITPVIVNSNQVVSSNATGISNFNGYLVDEDYFSSAGSGANSSNSSQSDMYLECVDMGVSILCGSLGLDPSVSLDPQDGYYYSLSNSDYLNSENYIQYPHWRKFKIGGLGDNLVENGQLMFKYESSNGTSSVKFLIPEVVDGQVYFYLYQTYQNFGQGCVSAENIGLSIPLEHSWLVQYYSGSSGGQWSGGALTKFEIYYQSNGSYKSAGLLFSWN